MGRRLMYMTEDGPRFIDLRDSTIEELEEWLDMVEAEVLRLEEITLQQELAHDEGGPVPPSDTYPSDKARLNHIRRLAGRANSALIHRTNIRDAEELAKARAEARAQNPLGNNERKAQRRTLVQLRNAQFVAVAKFTLPADDYQRIYDKAVELAEAEMQKESEAKKEEVQQ